MARKRETLALRRRRESRREEYATQRQVIDLLVRHVDQRRVFFTSIENQPRSAFAAMFQAMRGVRPGLPDLMILHDGGRAVFVELKSRRGQASPRQREIAQDLAASGARWFLARTARAALAALHMAGVDLGRWKPPAKLLAWEGPFPDPLARLPMHPGVLREQRAARRRWRLRALERQREAARRAAQPSPTAPAPQPEGVDARA